MIKEFKSIFIAPAGLIFLLVFVCATGCFLWLIPGAYNIPESGYASLDAFFALVPLLLILLIPALCMRVFSEEKKAKTLDLLLTRPVSVGTIIRNKIFAVFLVVLLAFLITLCHLQAVFHYALPVGNLDMGAIAGSYAGILCLSMVMISVSVFASSVTSNQVLAFIFGFLGCAGCYYGFDLVSGLFSTGKIQLFIQNLGLLAHVKSMQRGVIDSRDLIVLFSVFVLFYLLTYLVLSVRKPWHMVLSVLVAVFVLNTASAFFNFRWDLTSEKRYTVGPQTRQILHELHQPIEVILYLDGDLNAGFTRLKQSSLNILDEFSAYSSGTIHSQIIDPYQSAEPDFIEKLQSEGIRGIAVNERNKDGKIIQKMVFPWMKIASGGRSVILPLLVHQPYRSGEENLNASIENLEYRLISGIYSIVQQEERKIAFLEGHGELTEKEVKDVTDKLSHYYSIDRGELSGRKGELDIYKAVVIAGPQQTYSEGEKFILDQYLMQGGKILMFLNGVRLDYDQLAVAGATPSMANDVNLDDMLFTYGVRINPVLLEDAQCIALPVNTGKDGAADAVKPIPWYYAPLLNPVPGHPVTKDILPVKSEFVSSLDFTTGRDSIEKTPLLVTSDYTHIVHVPEMITFELADQLREMSFFEEKKQQAAVLLEGIFTSLFYRRAIPEGVIAEGKPDIRSKMTKIIVVASEEIIRNDVTETNGTIQYFPVGYDRYSQTTFGNGDFIINAVNYLTDDAGLMQLRSKQWKLRLLDMQRIQKSADLLPWLYIVTPSLILIAIYLIALIIRKKQYFY